MGFLNKNKERSEAPGGPTAPVAETTVNPELPIAAMVVEEEKPVTRNNTLFIDSRRPVMFTCPHCKAQNIKTRTRTAPAFVTWLAAGVTLIVLWPVCWLPLVLDSCKETQHSCPNCGREVGKVEAFSDCCVKSRG